MRLSSIRYALTLSCFVLLFAPAANATHIVGGDMSYECLGNNQYRVTMRVYRDCFAGQAPFDNNARIRIFTGPNGTTPFGGQFLVGLDTEDPIPPDVGNPCLTPPPEVCVEVGLYEEIFSLPYNPNGYHISYQRCCRNGSISNIFNPGDSGATYTIFISDEAQQTCNSSPTFTDFPPIVICANEDVNFDNSGFDAEGDLLIYSFCAPFLGGSDNDPTPLAPPPPYSQVSFVNPFTASVPLGGNPTVSIDPNTGLISGSPDLLGQYVVGVCIEEYRVINGVQTLLSITKRDFQFNVVNCVNTIEPQVEADEFDINTEQFIISECGNTTVTLSNESTPQNLIEEYYWVFYLPDGDSIVSSAIDPVLTFPGIGNYPGSVTINPNLPTCSASANISITVNPDITAAFEMNFDECSLDPIQFTDQTIAEAGGVMYNWDFGDGNTSNEQNPEHVFLPGDYTITLTVEDVNGCTDQISQDITYYPAPDISFDISDEAGCIPHPVTFTNTSSPFTSDYDILWGFGDGTNANTSIASYTYETPGMYDVTLIMTSPTGCEDRLTFESIDVQQGPLIDFAFTDPCIVGPISFTDETTSDGGPITSWTWNLGDGTTSSEQNPTHSYTDPGTYEVTLVLNDVENCTKTKTDTVFYYPPSVIDITTGPTTGCQSLGVDFTNNSMPLTDEYLVEWDFGDGNTSTEVSPNHNYAESGLFTVTLTISTPGGECVTQESFVNLIEIFQVPEVTFEITDPCEPGPITYTETIVPGDGAITEILWDFGDGNTSTESNPTHEFAEPGSYTVTFSVIDENDCEDEFSQLIAYFPAPNIDIDFDNDGCTPHTTTFTNNSNPITNAFDIHWDFGDGGTAIELSPTYTYETSGTYTVTLTITSPNDCVSQEVFNNAVFVRAGPVAAFDFSDICVAGAISFTNTTVQGDGTITETNWDFGDGNTSTQTNPDHNYASPGDYTVTLDIVDEYGCESTVSQDIAYYPAPIVNINFDTEGCTPHTLTFDNASTPLFPNYTYAWDFGDGNTSTEESPMHTYDTPGVYTVTLTINTPGGCIANETFNDGVFVQIGPSLDFSYSDLCALGPIQFTDESTEGDGALSNWTWDFGDGNTSTEQNPLHEYDTPGTYTVELTTNDVNGCNNSVTQTIDYYPSVQIEASFPSGGCQPLEITFTNNTMPFTSDYTIEWDFGDGTTSTEINPTHTYVGSDLYDITVSIGSSSGCVASRTYENAIFVYPKPIADFTYVFDSCAYEPAMYMDASRSEDIAIDTWFWDFGDGTTTSDPDPTHAFAEPGSYDVSLSIVNGNGCADTLTQLIEWYPTPFIEVDIDTDEGCQPLEVSFENNTFPLAGYTTEWDFGDGNTGTDQEPIHIYENTGTFDVTLVVTSPIGCQETEFYPSYIHVDSVPAVDFLPNSSDCLEGIVDFTDLTPPNGADLTLTDWFWDFGDGNTSTERNPSHTYSTSGTYNVSLTVTSSNGCVGNITYPLNWEFIPSVDFTVDEQRGCQPHTVSFFNDAAPITGWVATWNFGDGTTATGLNPVHTYTDVGVYDVSLNLSSPFGCTLDVVYANYITVDTIPTADFNFDYSCTNVAVAFTDASAASGAPIVDWSWDFGDGNSSNEQNPEHVYPPVAENYTITLTVTDENGCTDTATQNIDWFPSSLIDFMADDDLGCSPHTVTFFNNTMPLDAGYELLWDLGNGETSTELEPTTTYDNGYYTVSLQVTAPTGCVTELTLENYIRVTPPPVAGFTYNPTNPSNINPDVTFTETAENDTQWSWDFGNGDVSNQPNPIYTYPDTGYYAVTLYVSQASGCRDSLTQIIDVAPEYTYFLPNAFTPNFDNKNDGFKGKGITWTLQEFEMTIFNRWGERVFQTNDPDEAWNGRKNNTGQASPNGVYVYLVTLVDARGEPFEYKGYATLVR